MIPVCVFFVWEKTRLGDDVCIEKEFSFQTVHWEA